MRDTMVLDRRALVRGTTGLGGFLGCLAEGGFALAKPSEKQMGSTTEFAAIIDVVNRVGILADLREWAELRDCFADQVLIDYTSRDGGEPRRMAGAALVDGWRERLGGFTATQHLIGNHLVEVEGDRAVCRSLFKSQHRLQQEQWDLDGHYRHELVRDGGRWRVTAMQMVIGFERGDRNLVERAGKRAER